MEVQPVIQVTIKYFAMMRERLGIEEEILELQDGSTLGDVRRQIASTIGEISPLLDRSMPMVNQEYADPELILHDGDEIAFIPPVSGGNHVHVHTGELDQSAITSRVQHPAAGAVVTFEGVVRDNARGKTVTELDYEAYDAAAERQLQHIIDEMHERWSLHGVAIEHRTGLLKIGETSVIIAVSSTHRENAFQAAAYAIARIKEIVPIWKKEFYEDGDQWIGSEADYQREIGRTTAD